MSSPDTRLGEAEKQLRLAGEQLGGQKGRVAEELATLVKLFAEGVGDD